MPKLIKYYVDDNNKIPFVEWIESLRDKKFRNRIEARINRIAEFGHYGDKKSVGDCVFELRFDFGSGYRVYYMEVEGIVVILLCGGDKSTQKKDIENAKKYRKKFIAKSSK